MIGFSAADEPDDMADGKQFRFCGFAVIFILLLAINFSNADNFYQDASKTEDEANSAREISSLIDSNGRLRLGWRLERNGKDDSAIAENGPIEKWSNIGENAVTSRVDVEPRRRKKRFVFLLPLAPLFGGLSMGTVAAGAAAVGVGTAAAVAVSSNQRPIQMPRLELPYSPRSSIYMESKRSKKPEKKTEPTQKPRKGQLPPGQTKHPTPKELPAFPDFEKSTPKAGRPRWTNPKTKEFLEWDDLHGELEKYDKRGKHLGAFDKDTGKKRDDVVKGRSSEP